MKDKRNCSSNGSCGSKDMSKKSAEHGSTHERERRTESGRSHESANRRHESDRSAERGRGKSAHESKTDYSE